MHAPSALVALLLAASSPAGSGTEALPVAGFGGPPGGLPEGWEPLRFSKIPEASRYALVRRDGGTVLRAESQGGASGLVRRVRVDLGRLPRLRFRWRVENLIETQDLTRKEGDDSPVRVYVLFEAEPERLSFVRRLAYRAARLLYGEVPTRSLVYVWATRPAPREVFANPYTDLVATVIAETGRERVGEWVEVERDVRADYRRAFGEDPPSVRAVAVMTDTDQTGEAVVAYYGEITFLPPLVPGGEPGSSASPLPARKGRSRK